MHVITALKGACTHGGPMVFGAGLAMFAFNASSHGRIAAAPPGPTVTVTRTPAPITGRTTSRAAPAGTPTSARTAEPRVLAAAEATSGASGPAGHPPAGGAAPGPSPTPSPPPAGPLARLGVRASALVHINPTGGSGGTP